MARSYERYKDVSHSLKMSDNFQTININEAIKSVFMFEDVYSHNLDLATPLSYLSLQLCLLIMVTRVNLSISLLAVLGWSVRVTTSSTHYLCHLLINWSTPINLTAPVKFHVYWDKESLERSKCDINLTGGRGTKLVPLVYNFWLINFWLDCNCSYN